MQVDIQQLVATAIESALTQEKLQVSIDKLVSDAINDSLKSAFGYSSQFRKDLDAAMAERMPATVAAMGAFSDTVVKIVAAQLEHMQNEQASTSVKKLLADMTETLPAQMKVSELVARAAKAFRDQDHIYDYSERNAYPTLIFRRPFPDSGVLYNHFQLCFDPEEDQDERSCKYVLDFNSEGLCTEITIDEEKLGGKLFVGKGHGLARILLQLYTQQVKVIADIERIDPEEYPYHSEGY